MPVISGLTYAKTDSTIVATWTTDVSSDSNLFAGSKAAIDNGVAASGTSHQCIVTGLFPSTTYKCHVVSGGTSSVISNVTTNAAPTRTPILSASMGAVAVTAFAPPGGGDSQSNFISSDNITYITENDTFGFSGANNAGGNSQLGKLTNESTFAGADVNLMTSYGTGGVDQRDGTDGPSGTPLRSAINAIFGMNTHLFMLLDRNNQASSPTAIWYGNVIRDNGDHGATWNRFDTPSSFLANGHGPADGIFEFPQSTYAVVGAIPYAPDDGTLGYTTSGNGFDGANAYVYLTFINTVGGVVSNPYLLRWPRIYFDASNTTGIQYWAGTGNTPADFVNDANWSNSDSAKQAIFNKPTGQSGAIIFFIQGINRYVLINQTAESSTHTSFVFYEAATPNGIWKQFFNQINTPNGWISPAFLHRDSSGNSATDNIPIHMLFSGDFNTPALYKCRFATLTLKTTGMTQIATYNFVTVENPLSNGGNFTTCPSMSALQVPSANTCEATSLSTHCGAYWSAAVPAGDTGGTWPADQYSEVTIASNYSAGNGYYIPLLRQNIAANTNYRAFIITGPSASLFQAVVAGTAHTLSTFTASPVANDKWRFTVVGNVLTLTQNGTQIATFTDTNNFVTAAGPPGLDIFSTDAVANEAAVLWAGGANQAAAPTFSPPDGAYSGTQAITINGPASSTIYYTLDGTQPTRSSPSFATGGTVTVSSTKTIKAIASLSNNVDSQVSGANFNLSGSVKTTHQQLRNLREGRR